MKKQLLFALPILALTSGALAADVSPYISLKVGTGSSFWDGASVEPSGGMFAGAVGAKYELESANLRGEFEYSGYNFSDSLMKDDFDYFTNAENTQQYNSYLANFYVDFLKNYKLKPYVGFGLGLSSLKEKVHIYVYDYSTDTDSSINISSDSKAFVYGINGGLGFNFTDGLGCDLGMRYMTGKFNSTDINTFMFSLGLRYTF